MVELRKSETKDELIYLSEISKIYPTIDSALAKISMLQAALAVPKGAVHVISDVHGEAGKLRHIINNASGSLRPLVDSMFQDRLSENERFQLLNFIYYPREAFEFISPQLKTKDDRFQFLKKTLAFEFELIRELAKNRILEDVDAVVPSDFRSVFREVLLIPATGRSGDFADTIIEQFQIQQKEADLLRMVARVVRNLCISEIIVAGDLGDRGPRIDKVIDFLSHQPHVRFTWGNHDASWLGACLGDLTCIATVIRISLRYRRLAQLEEGYGVPVAPLEKLVRSVYSNDSAERFACKGGGLRDPLQMARMQKAMAIIQFKLEGQTIKRNPHYNLEHRNLLHRISKEEGSVEIDGKRYPMLDMNLPTIDWSDPYKLSPDEEACMLRMQKSFLESPIMWDHMRFVVNRGAMHLIRDKHLIFHACVPVDEKGDFLSFEVDGVKKKGKEVFDAIGVVVHRALRQRQQKDLDLLWYLWSGPLSPWFGKDKMATFETYFVADKDTQHETKNPYFKLIHEVDFCLKILKEFSIEPDEAMIVNGHVPVKIEKGESPLKKSGLAVTIDGAFSEAYGDKGYTLVLEPEGTYLAQHHHFESIEDAIKSGTDIIPSIQEIRHFSAPHRTADTEKGEEMRAQIQVLEKLIQAYRDNLVRERIV